MSYDHWKVVKAVRTSEDNIMIVVKVNSEGAPLHYIVAKQMFEWVEKG